MFETVLVDLDGTLVDSAPGIVSTLRVALFEFGFELTDDELLAAVGPPFQVLMHGLGMSAEATAACISRYRELYSAGPMFDAKLYDGAQDALQAFVAAGRTVAIATSKATPYAQRVASHFGIDRQCAVFGSEVDGRRVAKAEVITYALTQLGRSAGSAVMIGDRDADVVGAQEVGVAVVGAAWGYAQQGELEAAGCDFIAGDWPSAVGHVKQ